MNYMKLNALAIKTIKKMGIPISVTRHDGTAVGDAHAVVTPSESKLDNGPMPGSVMATVNKTLYVTANTQAFAPQPGDTVTSGENEWLIVMASDIKPADVVVAWKLEVV